MGRRVFRNYCKGHIDTSMGRVEGDNREDKRKGHQGTYIKDLWTKPKWRKD